MAMRHVDYSMVDGYIKFYENYNNEGGDFVSFMSGNIYWIKDFAKKEKPRAGEGKYKEIFLCYLNHIFTDSYTRPCSTQAYIVAELLNDRSLNDALALENAMKRANTNENYDLFRKYLKDPNNGCGLVEMATAIFVIRGRGVNPSEREVLDNDIRYFQLGM